jgi:hypothetical protein
LYRMGKVGSHRAPPTDPAIPGPCHKAEISGMRNRRSEAGPGLEVIETTSYLVGNRPAIARLLERVRTRIQVRNLSPRTEKTYLGWIERYIGFHGRRDPARMGRAEMQRRLLHFHRLILKTEGRPSLPQRPLVHKVFQRLRGTNARTRLAFPSTMRRRPG